MAEKIEKLFDLQGKTAVVTGGSGAICGALAKNLAHNGVTVIIIDINGKRAEEAASAIRKEGGAVAAFECDVLDEDRLEKISYEINQEFGSPHLLLNGAGGNHPAGSTTRTYCISPSNQIPDTHTERGTDIFDLDIDGFRKVLDLNYYGTLIPSIVFGREMIKKKQGAIVNISSMSGITPLTRVPAYSSAKAAVINLTKWLAVHFAESGVRVNTIAPGFIETEQSRFLQFDSETGEMNERGKEIIAKTPFGRYGDPEEIFGTLVWLFSEASKFVTGTVIPVDGGFSSYSL